MKDLEVAKKAYKAHFLTDDMENFDESFCGFFKDKRDFVESLLEENPIADKRLAMYFDFDKYTRDIFIDSFSCEETVAGLAVFRII